MCALPEMYAQQPVLAADWCQAQPCWQIGNWTISQPSSSVLVYFLAAYTLFVAAHFWRNRGAHQSRLWWSISLLLTGIGAAVAGTSFQAFGYMIKCQPGGYCQLSSWWEIVYNILTVWGAGALLIAVAHAFFDRRGLTFSYYFAAVTSLLYTSICLYGAFSGRAFLISFELMILFCSPAFVGIVGWMLYRYYIDRDPDLRSYLLCWAILLITTLLYSLYLLAGLTLVLWQNSIWFSENDVLHVCMILWCYYVYRFLSPEVRDRVFQIERATRF